MAFSGSRGYLEIWMDVVIRTARILPTVTERIGFFPTETFAKCVWEGLYGRAWIEEAHLLLAGDWERRWKETFVESQVLVKLVDEWDRIIRFFLHFCFAGSGAEI